LAQKIDIGVLGGTVLFLPVFAAELCVMMKPLRTIEKVMDLQNMWNKADTLYSIVVTIVCLLLFGFANLLDLFNDRNDDVMTYIDNVNRVDQPGK